MIRFVFVIIFSSFFHLIFSQSLSPTVFASSGRDVKTNDYQLSYTIGEVIVTTVKSSDYILTQGFHQWPLVYISGIKKTDFPDLEVKIFPNPAADYVNVQINNYRLAADCVIEFYNIFGQKFSLPVEKIQSNNYGLIRIDLQKLDKGTYFVRVLDSGFKNGYTDFKIVKVR